MFPRVTFRAAGAAMYAATFLLASLPAHSQTPPAQARPAAISCSIRKTPVNDGDIAFSHGKFDDAIAFFRKQTDVKGDEGNRIHNALIRAEIRAGKVSDAKTDAKAWSDASPKDAWAMASLAEVQLRLGDIDEAGKSMRDAAALNFCVAQVHADYARYLMFVGFRASAKGQLEIAHKLDPIDDEISGDWVNFQPRAQRAAAIDAYISHTPFLTDKERKSWQTAKDRVSKAQLYPCSLSTDTAGTTLPLHSLEGRVHNQQDYTWGLDVSFNGANRLLELDTGASGLVLTRTAASALGLEIEDHTKVGGFGDDGPVDTSIALVKSLKIGDLTFHNCGVSILSKNLPGLNGLIGGDVFQHFLLTIDFPGRVVKLDPLPPLPGKSAAAAADLSVETGANAGDAPPQDRYIDPSMASWTKVFRLGDDLLLPVRLNGGPIRLFLVDTGNFQNEISINAAREVTHVERGSVMSMQGVSGEATHLDSTGPLTLDFAGLRQPSNGMIAMDLNRFGGSFVEVSGFLGSPTLHQLTVQIDYRDQLMKFTYDPSRLVHCAQGMVIENCY